MEEQVRSSGVQNLSMPPRKSILKKPEIQKPVEETAEKEPLRLQQKGEEEPSQKPTQTREYKVSFNNDVEVIAFGTESKNSS